MDVVPDQGSLHFLNDLGKEEDNAGTSQVATAVNEKEEEERCLVTHYYFSRTLDATNIRYGKSSYYFGKFSTNNRRIVKKAATRWIFNSLRYH